MLSKGHKLRFGVTTILCLFAVISARAQTETLSSDKPQVREYYTFDEKHSASPTDFQTPDQIFLEMQQTAEELATSTANSLTKWLKHDELPATPHDPYNRRKHFGTWVNDPDDETCYNTRAQVLIRDSSKPVTFSPKNHCLVVGGLWKDPYSGELFESAKQIQIDHVVPLKHAYMTGAWGWKSAKRCTYANFLKDNYHLLAVGGSENMRKGDRSPDEYMPPDESYTCSYLQKWLKVKFVWGLFIGADEAKAISSLLKSHSCKPAELTITQAETQKLRRDLESAGGCDSSMNSSNLH